MAEHKSQEEIDREYEEIEKTIDAERNASEAPTQSGTRGGPPRMPEDEPPASKREE